MKVEFRLCRSWLLASLFVLSAACASTGSNEVSPYTDGAAAPRPDWMDEALSWNKLDLIESWLASADAERHPELKREAELTLAEGRLEFSERDATSRVAPTTSLKIRLDSARQGFEKLLAYDDLTILQRNRAEVGRRRSLALLGVARPRSDAGELHIVRRSEWGAAAPVPSRLTPMVGSWTRITIHHSAETTSTASGGSFDESARTLRSIQRYAMEDRNPRFGDIGYHYIIDSAGRIYEGRPLQWQGAHARGQNNYQNLGICLLGEFSDHTPTEAALASLGLLLNNVRASYRIPSSRVFGHRDLLTTECPGDALQAWIHRYKGHR